jgi:hypothetical protein
MRSTDPALPRASLPDLEPAGVTPRPRVMRMRAGVTPQGRSTAATTKHPAACMLATEQLKIATIKYSHPGRSFPRDLRFPKRPLWGAMRGRGDLASFWVLCFAVYSLGIAFRSRYVQLSKLQNRSRFSSRWPKQISMPLSLR